MSDIDSQGVLSDASTVDDSSDSSDMSDMSGVVGASDVPVLNIPIVDFTWGSIADTLWSEGDGIDASTLDAAETLLFVDSSVESSVESSTNIEEKYSEDNDSTCNVCYNDLNIKNIVNTKCGHVFCRTCFFRWMKQSTNCPMCRRNFVSISKWYENTDVDDEINNFIVLSNKLQKDSVVLSRDCRVLEKYKKNLEFTNSQNIKRQISLKQQIEYTEGFIHGMIPTSYNNKLISRECKLDSPWFCGFSKSVWNLKCAGKRSSSMDTESQDSVHPLV